MEKKKWVSKTFVPQQGKTDKNIYFITEEGRCELLRWLSDNELGLNSRTPILMKVFFMGEQSREENIRYFDELIAYCRLLLEGPKGDKSNTYQLTKAFLAGMEESAKTVKEDFEVCEIQVNQLNIHSCLDCFSNAWELLHTG